MSVLALADTGKYITEGCLSLFLYVYVGTSRYRKMHYWRKSQCVLYVYDTGKYITEGCFSVHTYVIIGTGRHR